MPTEIDRAIDRADAVTNDDELPEPRKAKAGMKKASAGRGKFEPPFVPLKREEVEAATSLSRSTIYAMINPAHEYYDPGFPKPLRFGAKSVRWRADEIEAWMLSRERTHAVDSDA